MNNRRISINSEEGVSETIGYSLILSIIVIAITVLVVIAYPIQSNIQDTAFVESQIQALTMLDSRISSVGFGSSPSQLTRINLNGGVMNVQKDAGNYLKVMVSDESGYNETIFNETMGIIEYKLGDNKLIYENGGMFRIYPNGESVMLSPPEFYYNGETLTFPVMRIASSAYAGGKGTISVVANSPENGSKIIYPNLSSSKLMNPIYAKQIKIRIRSDNYLAWARYIEERTDAVPLPIDTTKEVVVAFNSKPSDKPEELKVPIEVFGLDTTNNTPLNQFMFNLSGFDPSYHMTLRAPTSNSTEFVIDVKKAGGGGSDQEEIQIKYNKDGFNETWFTVRQEWVVNGILVIDLLNDSTFMDYTSGTPSGTWINETPPYNKIYDDSVSGKGPVPLDRIMQHYMALISESGTFAISPGTYQGHGDNDPEWPKGFNVTGSTLVLDYNIQPPVINYMHIVDHQVNITIT